MKWNFKRFAKRAALSIGLLTSLFTANGCFGSKAPERTYFSIDYALNEQPHYVEPKFDKSVVIHNFTTTTAYDRQELVYRSNPYEFQYYWYRLWASKPRKMLREIVSKHLRYMNIFSGVTLAIEDRVPDYEMDVEITAIEELDASKTEWYAHIAMRMTLSSFEDGSVVWSRDIDVKNAVADNKPVYVVKAMSELLDSELTKAFKELDQSISQHNATSKSQVAVQTPKEQLTVESDASTQDEPESMDAPRATLKNKR